MLKPLAILTLTALATPALASPELVGQTLGTDAAAITAALKEAGYDVGEIEREDGRIEVEARNADGRWEIRVDRETGKVSKVERDD